MVASAEKLFGFLSEILELAKLEAGDIPLEHNAFDIRDVVTDAIHFIESDATNKGLEVRTHYADNIPNQLYGDRLRVKRILLNLLSNAVKFTPEGHISISVHLGESSPSSTKLYITVEDTGIGILENKYNIIFGRFNRLDSAESSPYNGVGLGLAIVKKLLNDIDGDITVSSQFGVGSTFTCNIPFQMQKPAIEKEPDNKKPKKILIVEDDPVMQEVLRTLIADEFHYHVDITSNAEEALLLAKNGYHAILTDIGLPGKDGVALILELKREQHLKTPIIVITANASKKNRERCLEAGISIILEKPIAEEKLKEVLESVL